LPPWDNKEDFLRQLKAEIKIAAKVDQVWQTLTDFENWHEWNPTVKRVTGATSQGSTLKITMPGKASKDMSYPAKIVSLEPPTLLRWRAKMIAGFIFANGRLFELKEHNGGTLLVNTEEFSGLMVPLMWNKLNQFVVPTLKKMNEALKAKLEGSV
jgi:hypothetical protein